MNYYIELKDRRNKYVFDYFKERGVNVYEYIDGDNNVAEFDTIVFSPAKKLSANEVMIMPNNISLISGNINDETKMLINSKNINYINILQDEVFVVKNAGLTAEGTLALLIKESEKSIYKNNILILGTGRVG